MIWVNRPSMEDIKLFFSKSMESHMGFEFCEMGNDFISGKIEISDHHRQPIGVLHGGTGAAFSESLANLGAHLTIDLDHFYGLCVDLNINHLRPVRSGTIYGKATALHLGRRTQVWNVEIKDKYNQLISVARVTKALIEHKDHAPLQEVFNPLIDGKKGE